METKTITVGMGATCVYHSDRHAYTVIAVAKNGKRCTVQRDVASLTSKPGPGEHQDYDFSPDPNGTVRVLSRRKNGTWRVVGDSQLFIVGTRSEFYDHSF